MELGIATNSCKTRAVLHGVLSTGNRAKPCKFRYVKPVGIFIRKILRSTEKTRIFNDRTLMWHHLTSEPRRISVHNTISDRPWTTSLPLTLWISVYSRWRPAAMF